MTSIMNNHNVPKPTPLNFNPLLYALFDMGGIATPAADKYEAHLFVQEQEPVIDAARHPTITRCGYPECCPQDTDDEYERDNPDNIPAVPEYDPEVLHYDVSDQEYYDGLVLNWSEM